MSDNVGLIFGLLLTVSLLTGFIYYVITDAKNVQPRIEYLNSGYTMDKRNITIDCIPGYRLSQSHPYDVEIIGGELGNEYNVVLHFEKEI